MSKKAQGLSINTIVLLILAVLVMVLIIAGFTMGWDKLFERLKGSTVTSSNIDAIVQACMLKCTTQQTYEFCNAKNVVKGISELSRAEGYTCNELKTELGNVRGAKVPKLDDCTLQCPQ